jgi:hypothetical protein
VGLVGGRGGAAAVGRAARLLPRPPGTPARGALALAGVRRRQPPELRPDGPRGRLGPGLAAGLDPRIDRFNDVYGAGVGGSLWGTLTRPTRRVWPETPYMLATFLGWAAPLLEAELAAWA